MKKVSKRFELVIFFAFLLTAASYGAGTVHKNASPAQSGRINDGSNDIAFISVWGSRPNTEKLKGFQHAILYNARGEVVHKIDIDNDSIYSLDKMIQKNKARGPLFIRMYRR